jgi:Tfp pilus assembly protein PilV
MLPRRLNIAEGFTLPEALVAASVLAMTVLAVIFPFTAAAVNQDAEARIMMATTLAEEILEEILAKPFNDPQGASQPGPELGETTRASFDNIDDYDNYAEPAGNVVSSDGKTVNDPAAAGLSRSVSAKYVYVSGQDGSEAPNFVRVTVTVKYRGQTLVNLTRLAHWAG